MRTLGRTLVLFLPLLGLVLVTARLWLPLMASVVGTLDTGETFEVNPAHYAATGDGPSATHFGSHGGEIILRANTTDIYANVLHLRVQRFPGSTDPRHNQAGTVVRGYFVDLPLPLTSGLFYYEEAPFVREWCLSVVHTLSTVCLLGLQWLFWRKRREMFQAA